MTVSIGVANSRERKIEDWDIFPYVANILNLALKKEKATESKVHINIFFYFKGQEKSRIEKNSKSFYILYIFNDISSYDILLSDKERVNFIYENVKKELMSLFSREGWAPINFSSLDAYFEEEVHRFAKKIKATYKTTLVYVYHYKRVEHFIETVGKSLRFLETKNYLASAVVSFNYNIDFLNESIFCIKSFSGTFGWKVDMLKETVQTVFFCKKEFYKDVYNEYIVFTMNRYITENERGGDVDEDPELLSNVIFEG